MLVKDFILYLDEKSIMTSRWKQNHFHTLTKCKLLTFQSVSIVEHTTKVFSLNNVALSALMHIFNSNQVSQLEIGKILQYFQLFIFGGGQKASLCY